ncbi:MAG: DUF2905 domain-containing protein [Bacteroidetes bacterium]|nr:DUF2905 domain-containing protein [Bacteroidota bacterium]
MNQIGKYIFIAGCLLALLGLIIWFLGDKLNWIGRLPGDIRIERSEFSMYIPITTMLIISLIISLMIKLIQFFKS